MIASFSIELLSNFLFMQRMYPTSEEVLISRMWSTEMQMKIREEKQLVESDAGNKQHTVFFRFVFLNLQFYFK